MTRERASKRDRGARERDCGARETDGGTRERDHGARERDRNTWDRIALRRRKGQDRREEHYREGAR